MEALGDWNLSLGKNLINVTGRVLPKEPIFSNRTQYDSGPDADWTKHVRSLPMFISAVMGRWVIVAPQSNVNDVQTFAYTLKKVSDGMSFPLPRPEMLVLLSYCKKPLKPNTTSRHIEYEI